MNQASRGPALPKTEEKAISIANAHRKPPVIVELNSTVERLRSER